jgi:tRNA threonylcarbamoyl adenosine modification protein YeaZ
VETSGALCSLAIHTAGRWFEDTQNVERLHNRVVLGRLDALIRRADISRRDIDVVAFGAGPGSFTGVRIAAALAQGVAYGCGAGVVPVSSSLALAAAAHGVAAPLLLTLTRSRREAYYLAGFRCAPNESPRRVTEDRLHQGDTVPTDLLVAPGVGDRPPWWPERQPFTESVTVTARIIGALALEATARGEVYSPGAALPVYVAGDSPWKPASQPR